MYVFWITILISILPLWFLQNIIHELSHGLTAYIKFGWGFSIYPFPSYKLGHFTFAHCKYEFKESALDIGKNGIALLSIMPKIVNIVLIVIAISISYFINSLIVAGILLTFATTNIIDYAVGISTLFRSKPVETDLWIFQKASGASLLLLRLTLPILFIDGSFLIIQSLLFHLK